MSVIEHMKSPRGRGALAGATVVGTAHVPGFSRAMVYLVLEANQVERIMFQSQGCGYTTACGSMLVEILEGKSISEAWSLQESDISDSLGGLPQHKQHCAELMILALQDALRQVSE